MDLPGKRITVMPSASAPAIVKPILFLLSGMQVSFLNIHFFMFSALFPENVKH